MSPDELHSIVLPPIIGNGGLASEPKQIRMACTPRRSPIFRSDRETCADLGSDVHNKDGRNKKRDRDAYIAWGADQRRSTAADECWNFSSSIDCSAFDRRQPDLGPQDFQP